MNCNENEFEVQLNLEKYRYLRNNSDINMHTRGTLKNKRIFREIVWDKLFQILKMLGLKFSDTRIIYSL